MATEPGRAGSYRPVAAPVWALQVRETFTVAMPDGRGSLLGKNGDWLVQYGPGDYGIVDAEIFPKNYTVSPRRGGVLAPDGKIFRFFHHLARKL